MTVQIEGSPKARLVTPTGVLILPAAADRATWLRARLRGVGSSDVASIAGVGYKPARWVYFIKTGELVEQDDDAGEAALWGNLHEETVAREWARRNKSVVRRIGLVAKLGVPWMICTLDRMVVECPLDRTVRGKCCLEVKTRNAFVAGKWRGGIPDDVHAQVLWQMEVNGFDHVHVACLIGGSDFRQFVVRRDPDLHRRVYDAASKFWHGNVLERVPPPPGPDDDYEQLNELENRLHPNRGDTNFLGDQDALAAVEWLRAYRVASNAATVGRKAKERSKYELLQILGNGSAAAADNQLLFTYDEVNRPRHCDFEKLLSDYPQAYEACVTHPTGRTLNIKWKPPKETDEPS